MVKIFNIRKHTLFFGLAVGLSFSACDNSESCKEFQANFIDSAVEGIEYRCGDIVNKTNAEGSLSCATLPISFYIGNVALGSVSQIPADKQIFPQDIVGVDRNDVNNSDVQNMALLLQSLDQDKNASNGINITTQQSTLFTENLSIKGLDIALLKEQLLTQDSSLTFKDMNEVVAHLNFSLGITTQTDVGGISDNNTTTENNTTEENNSTEEGNTTVGDRTAPTIASLTTTPTLTRGESETVEVNGEAEANVYVNDVKVGQLDANGQLTIDLATAGDDGAKVFNIIIEDSSGNKSPALTLSINKDTTAPAKNSTIESISTDDTTPPLSGQLPSGQNDVNNSNYTIVVDINGTEYDATNNQDGTWSIADDVINPLEGGFFSATIKVTDEAGNSSSTTLINKIEINNTGFLIDSAVEGIKYISGKYSGYTDINGLFKYEKGAGVTFYIGDESTGIPMGTAQTKVDPHNEKRKVITLFDLGGSQDENNSKIANMGRFLQTFDSDGDVSNGITIDKRTKESIALLGLRNLNFSANEATFGEDAKLQDLLADLSTHFGGHIHLLSSEDAKAHLVAVRDNTVATKGLSEVVQVRGEKQSVKVLTGIFQTTTGVVEGLDYRCGNQFGRTNNKGEFKYEEDKKVKFSIDQLNFGTAKADAIVTPANLVASTSFDHPRPRNIIRLLSVFDADANNANGIQIDKAVREALDKYRFQIDLNLQDGKANAELNIPQGVDEFGTQFEEFEMGEDILNEIRTLRAGA